MELLLIGALVLVMVVALVVLMQRGGGWEAKKIELSSPIAKVELGRKDDDAAQPAAPAPTRTEVIQQPERGSSINRSGIKAPAEGGARIVQAPKDDSHINDSPVELT